MIRYALQCDRDHRFESWFPDSSAFEQQVQSGLISCPVCESQNIHKAIMAPHIARTDRHPYRPEHPPGSEPDNGSADLTESARNDGVNELILRPGQARAAVLPDDTLPVLQTVLRELREKIIEETVDVGREFPEVVRKIHAGDEIERPVRGQASLADARALLEEGIDIMPIPGLPKDRN